MPGYTGLESSLTVIGDNVLLEISALLGEYPVAAGAKEVAGVSSPWQSCAIGRAPQSPGQTLNRERILLGEPSGVVSSSLLLQLWNEVRNLRHMLRRVPDET